MVKIVESDFVSSILSFDLGNLPKGIYSVEVKTKEGAVVRKVVLDY